MDFKKVFLACGLSAACTAFAAPYEAEDAAITKDAAVASNTAASGGKYVKMNGGDITFSKVTVEKAGDKQYNAIQIYTPPDRMSIAIEPMTAEPDTLNHHRDLIVIKPGEIRTFVFGAKFQKR